MRARFTGVSWFPRRAVGESTNTSRRNAWRCSLTAQPGRRDEFYLRPGQVQLLVGVKPTPNVRPLLGALRSFRMFFADVKIHGPIGVA